MSVNPPTPIRIPGISRKISVWVSGRGKNHTLYVAVRDMLGKQYRLPMGKLNFTGWKKMEALVPSDNSERIIVQQDVLRATTYRPRGLVFEGFVVEFDAFEASGTFYIYFDNFEAETDVFLEEEDYIRIQTPIEDRNDPLDDW